MTASIRLNGSPTPLQVVAATPVSLSNFDNTGVAAWQWTLLDRPAGSAATISGAASPTASITPDVPGSYLVRLRTWLDAAMTILDDVDKAITFVRYVSVPTWRVPAAGETTEVDPNRGWADEVNAILAYIQANLGGGSVIVGPAQAIYVDPVNGDDDTGARGRADLPFLTIGAAVLAMAASDDAIILAPGVHSVTATLPEPAFPRVSFIGPGRDACVINFNSGGGFLPFLSAAATLTDRLTMRGITIACATGDIGLVCDGTFGNGGFMAGGVVLSDFRVRRAPGSGPPTGFILSYCNRLDFNDVIIDGNVQMHSCWVPGSLSVERSRVLGLTVVSSTLISWDDDVASAFGFPMTRGEMRFRECDLGQVMIDGQPSVSLERCTYRGLTSLNPLGNSLTGLAAQWWELDCILDGSGALIFIDFSGAQAIQDVAVAPSFIFQRQSWRGVVAAAFERTAEINGRTLARFSGITGGGGFSSISFGLGIDGNVFGADAMPTVVVPSTGTFTPGMWEEGRVGPLVVGANIIPFSWGAAIAPINNIYVQADNTVPGEVLSAGAFTNASYLVTAAIGGGSVYVRLGWANGY